MPNQSKKNEQNTYISATPSVGESIYNTSIELIKQDVRYMKESIDSLSAQFKEFREQLITGFVTKEQHNNLENRVAQMENWKDWILKIVLGSIILALLALIGLGSK